MKKLVEYNRKYNHKLRSWKNMISGKTGMEGKELET